MIDLQSAAETLYGNSTPAQAPAPAPQAKPTSSAAEVIYGPAPAPQADAQRAEDKALEAQADAQRDVSTYGSALRSIESAALERLELSPQEAAESVKEWTTTFKTFGLSGDEAQSLTDVAVGAIAGGVSQDGWTNQARAALTREFGDGAQRALDAARALVACDPKLASFLDSTGLGSHPRVVSVLAAKAHHLRSKGEAVMEGLDLHDHNCSQLTNQLHAIVTASLDSEHDHAGPSQMRGDAVELAGAAHEALWAALFDVVSSYRMAVFLAESVDLGVVKLTPEQLAEGLALIEAPTA